MATSADQPGYDWDRIQQVPSHAYLAPAAFEWIEGRSPASLLDLGCGDGRLTARLAEVCPRVVGSDFAPSGIARAQRDHPAATFFVQGLDEPLDEAHRGQFEVVTAFEVIEHMLLPRDLFRRADEALAPGGQFLLTTPYHGYWKNLALAVAGKWDHHLTVDWDYGHVKFFSHATLTAMATEMGFSLVSFQRVGRIPPLAASMVAVFERSSDTR